MTGDHFIEFSGVNYPLIQNKSSRKAYPKEDIYNKATSYPKRIFEVIGKQYKRGILIVCINLYPVLYAPKSGSVSSHKEMKISIPTKLIKGKGDFRKPKVYSQKIIQHMQIENLELFENETEQNKNGDLLIKLNGGVEFLGICNPIDNYEYLLITNQTILDAVTDFTVHDIIEQKKSEGISATIVTVEDIYINYSGIDEAEKVRNFIIDAYSNWGTQYVLLGGDTNIIPMRKLWAQSYASGPADDIPSDLYYQCLDGNYNSDGDDKWGGINDGPDGTDVDLLAEVYVGRASAENAEEMSNFVYKTLAYKNTPASSPFLRNVLMVGEHLGFGGVAEYAKPMMEEIRLGSDSHNYVTLGFSYSPNFLVDTLYDQDDVWPKNSIINAVNEHDVGIINHLGHANVEYIMKFYNDDADILDNDNPIFAYSQGCLPGNFEQDCIAEHLTTSTRNGMFSVVFNSRYGWGTSNSTDGPSQRFNRQFWDAFFDEQILNLGAINADSHEDNLWCINDDCIRWCYYETNLFGDPHTMLRGQVIGPDISYSSFIADDSVDGNGDGLINPGESVDVKCILTNVGTVEAYGVTSALSTSNQHVTIIDDMSSYGNMQCCGVSVESVDGYKIYISPDCPIPTTINFELLITDNTGNSWIQNFDAIIDNTYEISGHVKAFNGSNPIAGVTVEFVGPISGTVQTDIDGLFMTNVTTGTYQIKAIAEGYLPSDVATVIVPPSVLSIDFDLKRPPELGVTPIHIVETIETGYTGCSEITVQNNGDIDLLFNATIADTTGSTQTKSNYLNGPDKFGYTWIRSDESGGPEFVWNDIRPIGTFLSLSQYTYEEISIGFEFPFYENKYASIFINSNGIISFDEGISGYLSQNPIPHHAFPNNYISAICDNWFNHTSGGSVCYYDDGNKVTIQFSNVANLFSDDFTFQIILFTSGKILFNYYSINEAIATVVGIENSLGTDGLEIDYYDRSIGDNLTIQINYPYSILAINPSSGIVSPSGNATINACFDASDIALGQYSKIISVWHNDPVSSNPFNILCTLNVILSVDSDSDGLSDSIESESCTDIYNPDSDNDGLYDGTEDANHNGTVDAGETDPCNEDTDNDGYNDGTEIEEGSDPLDPNSVPSFKPVLAAGGYHTILAKNDGTVIAVGKNNNYQCKVTTWDNIVHVAAGENHTLGLKSDGTVISAGDNSLGQCNVTSWENIIRIAAGNQMSAGLKSDGMVVSTSSSYDVSAWWGIMQIDAGYLVAGLKHDGTVNVTGNEFQNSTWADTAQEVSTWTDIVQVATGDGHVVGLKRDGTVVATGSNDDGQCDTNLFTDIIQIAAGNRHTIGLKSDGTVVAVGDSSEGQCDVSPWENIVELAAGDYHTVGIKVDGQLIGTGNNEYWQCNFKPWRDIIQISGYDFTVGFTVGLKSDGTVIAQGENTYGQCDVSSWSDIKQVAAGAYHTLGLKKDGTVLAVGYQYSGQCDVSSWTDITNVSAGDYHSVGLREDGTVVAVGDNDYNQCDVSIWSDIIYIIAAHANTYGVKSDGSVVSTGNLDDISNWNNIIQVSSSLVGLKNDGTVVVKNEYDWWSDYGQYSLHDWDYSPSPYWPIRTAPVNNSVEQPLDLSCSWHPSSNITSYSLQISTLPDFSSFVVDQSGLIDTIYQLEHLSPCTSYYWRINATNDAGTSAWSTIWNFRTQEESEFDGSFECSWGDWQTDNGVWEVGVPLAGPERAHNGSQCAGTVLDGDYIGSGEISRLISPIISLQDLFYEGEIYIGFWHWYIYPSNADGGWLQLSVYDETSDQWSAWNDLSSDWINGTSVDWLYNYFDISDYAGQKIQLAFCHHPAFSIASGWYIDDVRIFYPCEADHDDDNDIDGSDLAVLAQEYGICISDCDSDIEPDYSVGPADLSVLTTGFGKDTFAICPPSK